MPFDILALLRDQRGRNYDLHREHINPQCAKVLKTIGFDRCYEKAEGQYLWDVHGRKYLDMLGGYAVFNMGRNHPDIRRALGDFLNAEYASLVQMEAPLLSGLLAEQLKARVGRDLDLVYFTNSGAEGVETALKFARCATRRARVVHCTKAFHGLSTGALSVNGDHSFRDGFAPFLPGCTAIAFNDLAALEAELAAGDVAAFIVEPIQGKGVNLPAAGYLAEAARLCHRHGALFIADEIQTGMGRTGTFLALDQEEGCEPDMVIVSKALSGGFVPVGAVLMRKGIYQKVFSSMERAVVHSSTFGQGSLAMVAGLASLAVLEEHDLAGNAQRMGGLLKDGLEAIRSRFEFISEIRQRGLMIGIQFGKPRSLSLKTAWALIHKMDANLFPQAVTMPLLDKHGVLTQVAGHNTDCVKLIPPLVINEDDVRWFLDAFEQVMADIHQFPGPVWGVLRDLGKHAVSKREQVQA